MEIINVDDCIKSIKLENNTILYYRTRLDCEYVENNDNRNEYYFEQIPYEIGQRVNIEILDVGGVITEIFGNVIIAKKIH